MYFGSLDTNVYRYVTVCVAGRYLLAD